MKDTQSRRWCFTVNNPEQHGCSAETLEQILHSFPSLQYYIFSLEHGTDNNTPHFQGYFHTKNPVKFSTIRNKFTGISPHLEASKGTAAENRDYILKSGEKWADSDKAATNTGQFWEYGELPQNQQGKRTDWELVREMVQNNESDFAIIEACAHMIPHLKKIAEYRNLLLEQYIDEQKIKSNMENWIIFGPPETGKSTYAWDLAPRPEIYTVTNYVKPFDSFVAGKHTTIIYDEFNDINYDIRDINQWFDHFYQKASCRYYDRWLTQTKNIIVTNKRPEDFWKTVQRTEPLVWQAFCRRINRVLEFYSLGKYNEYAGMNEYLKRNETFCPVDTEENPFTDEQ